MKDLGQGYSAFQYRVQILAVHQDHARAHARMSLDGRFRESVHRDEETERCLQLALDYAVEAAQIGGFHGLPLPLRLK